MTARKLAAGPTIAPRIRTSPSEDANGRCCGSGGCERCKNLQPSMPQFITTSTRSVRSLREKTTRPTAPPLLLSGADFSPPDKTLVGFSETSSHLSDSTSRSVTMGAASIFVFRSQRRSVHAAICFTSRVRTLPSRITAVRADHRIVDWDLINAFSVQRELPPHGRVPRPRRGHGQA